MNKSATNSPKSKRLASQGVSELERDVVHQAEANEEKGSPSTRSIHKMRKLDKSNSAVEANNDEADDFFKKNMQNPEDLLGPQFCSLCDRNIAQSVKIRSTDHAQVGSTNKPLVVCLECHRTGVTIGSNLQTSVSADQA